MNDRQDIIICYDGSGHMINKGDRVTIPNEGTGKIYQVERVTSKSCFIKQDDNSFASYLATDCLKII